MKSIEFDKVVHWGETRDKKFAIYFKHDNKKYALVTEGIYLAKEDSSGGLTSGSKTESKLDLLNESILSLINLTGAQGFSE